MPSSSMRFRRLSRWNVAIAAFAFRTAAAGALDEPALPADVTPCTEVAGVYSSSTGYEAMGLELSATCEVAVNYWSDGGDLWDWRGTAQWSGSTILLEGGGAHTDLPDEFTVVPWGWRSYLVPSSSLLEFCNAVNSRIEPARRRWFLARKGPEGPWPASAPEVPPEYRKYLLAKPLQGLVLSVDREARYEERRIEDCVTQEKVENALVTVDLGVRDGLRPGMRLYARNARRPSFSADLRVTEVADATATAEVLIQYSEIRKGDGVSTLHLRR